MQAGESCGQGQPPGAGTVTARGSRSSLGKSFPAVAGCSGNDADEPLLDKGGELFGNILCIMG
jgi:hypothetical protein